VEYRRQALRQSALGCLSLVGDRGRKEGTGGGPDHGDGDGRHHRHASGVGRCL
jgi:hypothetical protein